MSVVVNKITYGIVRSVNTPDYSEGDWWINPVIPDCNSIYWKTANGKLAEMTDLQKQAKDLELANNLKYAPRNWMDIISDIKSQFVDIEQSERFESVLATKPFFLIALQNNDYTMARGVVDGELLKSNITNDDASLLLSCIPEVR